jgi:HTH-type transcriptional repressor of NAD biosynthesis genes
MEEGDDSIDGRGGRSRVKRGLVIGKFYPPHKGHKFLIDTALKNADVVDVLLCVREDQKISGAMREAWLREMCPAANVLEVADICDDDNSERWAEYVRTLLGRSPDVVFTSEDYGDRFAGYLGCEHMMVDRARDTVLVSATMIRGNPLQSMEYLEPCVRAHYVKRVCVLGAESTGTTTMARSLAEHFGTAWVPEFGREYAEKKLAAIDALTVPTYEWRSEEFEEIARRQIELEDRMAREANGLLFCDTNALATSVWHERYMNYSSEAVDRLASARHYDLYLLTGCDIPFIQDGTRDGELIREWMTRRLAERLGERGVPWKKLTGDHETRMRAAVSAVAAMLERKPKSRS